MAKRKLSKAARFERLYRVLEYLKRNTDSQHTITQAEMRKDDEISYYLGEKEAYNRLIKDIARTLNSYEDGYGYKPEKEWKLIFDDFKKYYGDNTDEEMDDDYDDYIDKEMQIRGLYYQRTFSYDEINSLIEGVLSSRTIDSKSAQKLIEKIETNLTTKFYKKGPKHICKVQEPTLADKELLRENLITIQRAIDDNVQVAFRFNGYSYKKKLEPIRNVKDMVSPYYIVASGGRYYLLACKEVNIKGKQVKNMSIWRIDLMTEIEIPGENQKLGIKGIPRIPKRDVENLPMEWSEDFQLKHLNMSYDNPEWITLRIESKKRDDDTTKRVMADYTFLHDWFGDKFRYIGTEKDAPNYDIVCVECSPFSMVNWALQYSDRVEVIEPEWVRNKVKEKVNNLYKKYEMEKCLWKR